MTALNFLVVKKLLRKNFGVMIKIAFLLDIQFNCYYNRIISNIFAEWTYRVSLEKIIVLWFRVTRVIAQNNFAEMVNLFTVIQA
jgi:hypothetical protein